MPALTKAVQLAVLLVLPHGGQHVARRNAWASMSANSAWARTRREAIAMMQRPSDQAATAR
jgi:hypothetical protein